MNILFLTNSIGYGGVAKMINFVSSFLIESGHNAIILNLNSISPSLSGGITQDLNAKVKVITYYGKRNHLSKIKKIVDVIRSYSIDAIIGFTTFPNFYATISSWITGKPSIISERGDPNRTFSKTTKDKILKFVINRSKGGVFQTKEASEYYSKGLRNRCAIIPNAIFLNSDCTSFCNCVEREKTVVSVGRFQNIQKRMDVLLKAFKIFSTDNPEYILKLYGSGEDDYVHSLITELELTDKVELMGSAKNPMSKISNDGMFVITSDYEGIPNALLEAMAIGLPVISTDCTPGGARLLIQDNINGQLVPIGDYQAVAKAMEKYASNPVFADKCGANATKVLETYSPNKIGTAWINYIEKILSQKVL